VASKLDLWYDGTAKCVEQVEDRWLYFVRIAQDAAQLRPDDVMMSVVPSPFGFGLWTRTSRQRCSV